jgi:serine/threonine protein kinase
MSESPPRNIEAGALIAERYRLEAPIGRGAMGSVWRAMHVRLDAPVAIKLLNASIAGDPVMVERFLREARAAAAVRSSHVVKIFDYGVDGAAPYIAMELLVGETLDARLEACGPLPPPEVDRIFGEIARAVGAAHELGVVHRDIKPANIFMAREGEHEVTKVLDFGIAKLTDRKLEAPAARATDTGILLGTPHYMSPEQARGHRQVDHRTDLWALAVLAFECLTGRHPFESETLGDLVVQICTGEPPVPSSVATLPAAFDDWFSRGVSKEPHDRFASAAEMASALHELLAAAQLGGAYRARSEPAPRRLERSGPERLAGATEVIGSTTSRGAGRPAPGSESAREVASGVGPSLNATSISAEVLPRSGPARRRQLALAALALPVLALVLTLSRRSSPPPAPRAGAAARMEVPAPAAPPPPTSAPLEGSAGGAPDGAPAPVAARNEDAAPAPASAIEPKPVEATPRPANTPRAPSGAPTARRRSPQRVTPTAPERGVARAAPAPAPPSAAEVAPAPASVPPSAADPYADRL